MTTVYTSDTPRAEMAVGKTVDPTTYAVTIQFAVAPSPYYVVILGPAAATTMTLSALTNLQLASMTNAQLAGMSN